MERTRWVAYRLACIVALCVVSASAAVHGKTYSEEIATLLARPGVRYVVVVPYLGEGLGADYDRVVAGWRQLAESYEEIGARFVVVGFSTQGDGKCHYPGGWEPALKICDHSGEVLTRWQRDFGRTGAQFWMWKGKREASVMDLSALGKKLLALDESPGVVQVATADRGAAIPSDEVLLPAITGALAGWSKMTVLGLGDEAASNALALFEATSAASRRAPCEWDFSDEVSTSVLLVEAVDGPTGRSLKLSWHLAERGCHVASETVQLGGASNAEKAGESAVDALMVRFHRPAAVAPWLAEWDPEARRLVGAKMKATDDGWNMGDDDDGAAVSGLTQAPVLKAARADEPEAGADPRGRLPSNVASLAGGPLIVGMRGGHFEFELDIGTPGKYFVFAVEVDGGADDDSEPAFQPGGTLGYRGFLESGIWNLLVGFQVLKRYTYGEYEYEYNVTRLKVLMGYHPHHAGSSWGLDFGAALGYMKMLRVGEYGYLQDGSEEDFSGFSGELYFMGRVLF
jgi:hypothetical protein